MSVRMPNFSIQHGRNHKNIYREDTVIVEKFMKTNGHWTVTDLTNDQEADTDLRNLLA